MASGLLGTANLAANTDTLVYTAPNGVVSCFNVNMCNRSASTVKVSLYLTTGAAPIADNALEFEASLIKNGILERSGLVLSAGQKLYARANAVGVGVIVYGIEEAV